MIKITEKNEGNIKVVALAGKIDAASTGEVEKRLNDLIAAGDRYLVLNFSGIEYINSSGLRVMLSSLKRLRKVKGDLKLACMRPPVKQVFGIAGFTQIFELYDREEEAVRKFNS